MTATSPKGGDKRNHAGKIDRRGFKIRIASTKRTALAKIMTMGDLYKR